MNLLEVRDELERIKSETYLVTMAVSDLAPSKQRFALNEGLLRVNQRLDRLSKMIADYTDLIELARQDSNSNGSTNHVPPDPEVQNA